MDIKELKAKAYDKIAEIEQLIAYTEKLKQELHQINQEIQKLQNEKESN